MSAAYEGASGQNHDRFEPSEDAFAGATMLSSQDDGGADAVVDINATQKMISAISGSLLTSLLVTPLDVVRVRLQAQGAPRAYSADLRKLVVSEPNAFRPSNVGVTACCREVFFMNNADACIAGPRIEALSGTAVECAVEETQKRTFNSTLDGMRKIARNEGLTTLWRGLSPTLVMAVPANIIYFTGYDWLRYNKASPINKLNSDVYAPLIGGSVARVLAATAVGPIELFRTRLQASPGSTATGHLANTFKGIKEMVAEYGHRSLWRGLSLTMWRDVPFSGIYWLGYESIRAKLTDMREERRGRSRVREKDSLRRARSRAQSTENQAATFVDAFTAGALSGSFASIVTMPFDVGKTRTQTFQSSVKRSAAGSAEKAVLAPEEQSMIRLLWHIVTTEGVSGLWRGWVPRTLKVAPSCAIMISSYEVGKRAFRSVNERSARRHRGGEGEP